MPVAVPVSAPVIVSVAVVPDSSVPVTVKVIPLSSAAESMVTFLGESNVTDPPEAKAPPIVKLAAQLTLAATLIPSGSAAAAIIKLEETSLPEPFIVIASYLYLSFNSG